MGDVKKNIKKGEMTILGGLSIEVILLCNLWFKRKSEEYQVNLAKKEKR